MAEELPLVSVIIPCYNQGQYLKEAIDSVLKQSYDKLEIVIVNDGSTDELTLSILKAISDPRIKIVNQRNMGLADARNKGITNSKGDFVLPLDSDDKIAPSYIQFCVRAFSEKPNIAIAYSNGLKFGEESGIWKLPEFSLIEMLKANLIHCSGLFKRKDYDLTRGYDTKMKFGWEDWDFWLSLLELRPYVHKISDPLFYYRIRKGSMVRSLDANKIKYLRRQIVRNHPQLYLNNFESPLNLYDDLMKERSKFRYVRRSAEYRIGKMILGPYRFIQRKLHA